MPCRRCGVLAFLQAGQHRKHGLAAGAPACCGMPPTVGQSLDRCSCRTLQVAEAADEPDGLYRWHVTLGGFDPESPLGKVSAWAGQWAGQWRRLTPGTSHPRCM